MSIKRVLGQQGFGNNQASIHNVTRVDEDYTADNCDDLIVSVGTIAGANTITLPENPFEGQEIKVAANGTGDTSVAGGQHPISGTDPTTVKNGTVTSFVFTTEGDWKPECGCPTSTSGGTIVSSQFNRVATPQVSTGDVFTDLVTVNVPVTTGTKLLIWSSWSFMHSQVSANTTFRIVVTSGMTDNVLDAAIESTSATELYASGAIDTQFSPTTTGTYAVRLQWKTSAGMAVVEPAQNTHAAIIVEEAI